MKLLKYTLIINFLIALCPISKLYACWGSWYLPQGYYMYRVADIATEQSAVFSPFNLNAEINCRGWQRYTSPDIPLTAIYEVVYKMPLERFEAFCENRWNYNGDNAFLQWLSRKDTDVSEFLLFAKITEDVRSRKNSRWYYPSMKSEAKLTLEEIVDKALNYQGPLRDRYLLQGIRALFSLHRYEDCIALWNNEISALPKENVMRRMILPYIAGAAYWMKHYDKAVAYYSEAEDYVSMIACSGNDKPASTVEAIARIYNYEPNCRYFPHMLQNFVRQAEPVYGWDLNENNSNPSFTSELRQLGNLALRIAQEGKTNNSAMWYYTAAFIEDLDGHSDKASRLLAKAEQVHGTDFIKESIKVFRIYLDAKLMSYNRAYEKHLFGQLQWLDKQITEHITPEVRERTIKTGDLCLNISYYYWNDMMRRIVLSEICPRMIRAGKPIRALQLANMADNRLLELVDCATCYKKKCGQEDVQWVEVSMDMYEFRRDKDAFSYDYSNSFFEMIDSIGVDKVIEYRNHINAPYDTFDCFLNERGYVDMDYINDIAGTQCLRTMRYGDAVHYLEQINRSFDGHLNTTILYDPFSYKRRNIENKSDFKYNFAREMWSLEQSMATTTDPDRKAELMIRYAIGIRNSFGRCWPLTQYYYGTSFFGQLQEKRDWPNEPEAIRAREYAAELLRKASRLFVDEELAATALYKINWFRTVAEKYPETEMGRYVKGQCDNWVDYMLK